MARRRRATQMMGREGAAMETCGTDSGASSLAEAQWKAMALRGVWQAKTGTPRMLGASCNDAGRASKAPVSSLGSDKQLRVVL